MSKIKASNHEEWSAKFAKSKRGRLVTLLDEVKECSEVYRKNYAGYNKLSYLASSTWLMAKDTLYEDDARQLIELIYPDFFKED